MSSIERKYLNIQPLAASTKEVIQENIGENIIMLNYKMQENYDITTLNYIQYHIITILQ